MIDTHAHIYLPEFDNDRDEVVKRARDDGIEKILMPNIDNSSIQQMLESEASYPGYCHAMMGLHPTSVKGDYIEQLNNIERRLAERDFIAIGEIGIDLYWDQTWKREQREVFHTQLKWAKESGLPVAIHVRNAFDVMFKELEKIHDHRLKGVFHSFSGSSAELRRALEYPGFMLGINGIVTFKNAGLDKTLTETTPDRIITETDAPFLAPVPYRGKRNKPDYMTHTLNKLAEIFGISTEEADRITTTNAKNLFAKVDNNENA